MKYFRHASSNAGGAGDDYWVVPVGWSANLPATEFAARAKAYCEKHAEIRRKTSEANERALKALLAAEEASRAMRASFHERIRSAQERIARIEAFHRNRGASGSCGLYVEEGNSYFRMNCHQILYTEENVCHLEEEVARAEAWAEELKAKDAAKAEFAPKFKALLEADFVALGYKVKYGFEGVEVFEPFVEKDWYGRQYPRELCHELEYSPRGIELGSALLTQMRESGLSARLSEMMKRPHMYASYSLG